MNPNDLFKTIRRIQIQSTHLANDLLAGAYRSAFKGKGMEFEEVREYQSGDEVRHIDWNVTARMNHPFVKSFREERELSVLLVVDVSASCRFGTKTQLKSELMAEMAAVIAFSAIKNNDKVGLLLFSDKVEKYIPPKKGVTHVLRMIRELLAFSPENNQTDMRLALAFLGRLQLNSGVCFLISDFFAGGYEKEMGLLSLKHDLIAVSVSDPGELTLPFMHLATLKDLETGDVKVVDTQDTLVQKKMSEKMQELKERLKKCVSKIGADLLEISTNQPYLPAFKKFFKMRGMRRR
jgi:uncharacterized protein (DUF58 family)